MPHNWCRITAALLGVPALLAALGHFFNRRRLPAVAADAALVFGCGQIWKAQARCNAAAQLFHQGRVGSLIVSGGVIVPGTDLTEAAWFSQYLQSLGVPQACILQEPRATNTMENVAFALPIIARHGYRTVILVMSDFEGIRAHLTAKHGWWGQGIVIYDYHAASLGYWNPWTWWLSATGWRLTCYTLPRLFRYRLLPYLWRRDPSSVR